MCLWGDAQFEEILKYVDICLWGKQCGFSKFHFFSHFQLYGPIATEGSRWFVLVMLLQIFAN